MTKKWTDPELKKLYEVYESLEHSEQEIKKAKYKIREIKNAVVKKYKVKLHD